ncbi:hypothetical protein [Streptomyces odonnellii]|uniref:hypothetical protein n=1 Tax=Streptomyces odonnellii TaxID=1417980 RepID=UPI000624FB08|nr:hypothetical protein [Streptomyces odonnellii]
MDTKPWKDRVREEEQLLEQLNKLASESATRRAQALREGVAQTGSIAEVARELGKSWNAVYNALKKQDSKKAPGKPDATTE